MNSYQQKNFLQPLATSSLVDFSVNSSGKLASSLPSSMTQRQQHRIQRKPSLPLSPGLILSTILAFLSREFRQYHRRATEDEIGVKLPFDNTISEFDRWNDGVFFERDDGIDMKSDNDFLGLDDNERTWNWGNMFGEWSFLFGGEDVQATTDHYYYKHYDHDDGDAITVSASEDEYQLHEDYQPARTIIH